MVRPETQVQRRDQMRNKWLGININALLMNSSHRITVHSKKVSNSLRKLTHTVKHFKLLQRAPENTPLLTGKS